MSDTDTDTQADDLIDDADSASYAVTDTERAEAKERVRAVAAAHSMEALKGIPPVALKVTALDPVNRANQFQPIVQIEAIVNPLLHDVLVGVLDCQQRGRYSYSMSVGEPPATVKGVEAQKMRERRIGTLRGLTQDVLDGSALYPGADKGVLARDVRMSGRFEFVGTLHSIFDSLPLAKDAKIAEGAALLQSLSAAHRTNTPAAFGAVMVSFSAGQLRLRIATCGLQGEGVRLSGAADGLVGADDPFATPNLDLLPPMGPRDPLQLAPHDALMLLEAAQRIGAPIIDDADAIEQMRGLFKTHAVLLPQRGAPGEVRILGDAALLAKSGMEPSQLGATLAHWRAPLDDAAALSRKLGKKVSISPDVADLVAMGAPEPYQHERLRPYQCEMVASHRAMNRGGILNVMSVGLGKTVTTMVGFREQWLKQGDDWRGLVVVPRRLFPGWLREADKWFPEATIAALDRKDVEKDLNKAFAAAGSGPALVLVSDTRLRDNLEFFTSMRWHDVALEEAHAYRNLASKRTQTVWELRSKAADRCVLLTGTAIDRSEKELDQLVGLAIGDEDLFRGRLFVEHDLWTQEGRDALHRRYGPTVFRRDRGEISSELPKIDTQTIFLRPTPQELALDKAAREQLREMWEDLAREFEAYSAANPDDAQAQEIKDRLKEARGRALGGVTLARNAASDACVLAESDSAGAKLLCRSGLVDRAIESGGTKREAVVDTIVEATSGGEAALVFTEFSKAAKILAETLEEEGIRVGLVSGERTIKQRDDAVRKFSGTVCAAHTDEVHAVPDCTDCVQPELDVLVLTGGAGSEGHNLQRASMIVHYDLPWTPIGLVQREGRVARFGSRAKKITVITPILEGTIEERVRQVVIQRLVKAMLALDAGRTNDIRQSEYGQVAESLADATSLHQSDNVEASDDVLELLKVLSEDPSQTPTVEVDHPGLTI